MQHRYHCVGLYRRCMLQLGTRYMRQYCAMKRLVDYVSVRSQPTNTNTNTMTASVAVTTSKQCGDKSVATKRIWEEHGRKTYASNSDSVSRLHFISSSLQLSAAASKLNVIVKVNCKCWQPDQGYFANLRCKTRDSVHPALEQYI